MTTITEIGTHPVYGRIVVADGVAYPLTPCCGASAKGSTMAETGVVCRSCYTELPASAGMGWRAASPEFAEIREEIR